jgi:methylenetetrahydrofolate reductase (NADPH)
MQLTCRDRNRIALQSDLLSASALGIPNVLLMTGDHPRFGDHADAKAVFDLDSIQLLRVARTMRDEGRLMSGRALQPPPSWFIGAVENPADPPEASVARLGEKVDAGAEFVQTQFVFDVTAFARWMGRVRDLGLHERCSVLAGVGPVLSLGALDHLQHRVPGVVVPEQVADRLRKAGAERIRDEGAQLCAEIIRELREVPGVAGVHVMAIGNQEIIPGILSQAGLAAQAGQAAAETSQPGGQAAPEAVPEDSLLEEGLLDDEPGTG